MIRIFRHHISKPLLLLLFAEALLAGIAVYAGSALLHAVTGFDYAAENAPLLPKAVVFAVVLVLSMTAMGLYQRTRWDRREAILVRIMISFAIALAVLSLVYYLMPGLYVWRGIVAVGLITALALVVVARAVFYTFSDQDALKRRILVLGTGEKAREILQVQKSNGSFRIVGFIHMRHDHDVIDKRRVLCPEVPLDVFAQEMQVDEIVVAVDDRRKSLPVHDILQCKMNGIQVVDFLTFFESETGRVRHDVLNPSWMIFSDGFVQTRGRALIKRGFDMLVSLAMLATVWPLMLATAFAVAAEGRFRHAVLFHQVRVGQDGQPFKLLKFRSMHVDAEKDGVARWAKKNDTRITKVGRFIRQTRLDELPQLFNVLRGEMSFVGPRPERPEFVVKLDLKIPYYLERSRVKPGITGWAQIRYPYGASEQDAAAKLQYDLYYVKNHSLFLDLLILLQTAEVVFWGKGAR